MNDTRDTVCYAQGGRLVEAPWRGNGWTVLQHLREERQLKGTKEGCAEGDCGACCVVVGEARPEGGVAWRSVNACIQPQAFLDGKLLVTVEDLAPRGPGLHPVQQAMVDAHASQCGFCTPGFVMSLYEQYLRSPAAPSSEELHEQLAGNLCRCTGYAPILKAGVAMHAAPRVERDAAADARLLAQLATRKRTAANVLSHGDERAVLARSAGEVAQALVRAPGARMVAGATDVGLWVTKHKRELPSVVYLADAADLRQVEVSAEGWRLGAAAPVSAVALALQAEFPELGEFWSRFAAPPVRQAATLGGNIANGSPVGDSMPLLMALEARLVLRRGDARRELPLDAFYLGYQKNRLEPGEFIEAVIVPRRTAGSFLRVYKVSKRHDDDISAVCCALHLRISGGGIESARVAYGGMAAVPARAPAAERALQGQAAAPAAFGAAAQAVAADFEPMSDHRASAAYRALVARNLLLRAGEEFRGGQPTRVVHYAGVRHAQ